MVHYGIDGAIAVRLASALLVAAGAMLTIRQLIGLSVIDQFLASWRAMVSVALMALVIVPLQAAVGDPASYLDRVLGLVVIVGAGALSYAGSMFLLWNMFGRPDGLEAHVAAVLASSFHRVRRAAAR